MQVVDATDVIDENGLAPGAPGQGAARGPARGDRLLDVDGTRVETPAARGRGPPEFLPLASVLALLRGRPDSTVLLRFRRAGTGEEYSVSLLRHIKVAYSGFGGASAHAPGGGGGSGGGAALPGPALPSPARALTSPPPRAAPFSRQPLPRASPPGGDESVPLASRSARTPTRTPKLQYSRRVADLENSLALLASAFADVAAPAERPLSRTPARAPRAGAVLEAARTPQSRGLSARRAGAGAGAGAGLSGYAFPPSRADPLRAAQSPVSGSSASSSPPSASSLSDAASPSASSLSDAADARRAAPRPRALAALRSPAAPPGAGAGAGARRASPAATRSPARRRVLGGAGAESPGAGALDDSLGIVQQALPHPPPPPSFVLIGHAASLAPY